MNKTLKRILLAILAVLLLAVAGFVIWGLTPLGPGQAAQQVLVSDDQVTVTNADWLAFAPAGTAPGTGLILYPGARVDYRSYAPLARLIAQEGYLVVITPMPLSLAVFSPDAAGAVIAAHSEITNWVIGGHSMGGAMAAQYAYDHPGAFDGLLLLAAYPPESADLRTFVLRVCSITASNDGVLDQETFNATRAMLPLDTRFVTIGGGNHAGFGDYGDQPGDGQATISPEDQWHLVVRYVLECLEELGP